MAHLKKSSKIEENFDGLAKLLLDQGCLDLVVADDDEQAGKERKVDADVEDREEVLIELEPAEYEEQEEDGDTVDGRLDDPGPEGRVDVDQVSPLSVLYHILERLLRISQIRLEKH